MKKTAAERYFDEQMGNPAFRKAYESSRHRIDTVDQLMCAIEGRCHELGLSSSEVAMLTGRKPSAIRRLFTSNRSNPQFSTILNLAEALELEIAIKPKGPKVKARQRITTQLSGV